jgi:hypothetical protein
MQPLAQSALIYLKTIVRLFFNSRQRSCIHRRILPSSGSQRLSAEALATPSQLQQNAPGHARRDSRRHILFAVSLHLF